MEIHNWQNPSPGDKHLGQFSIYMPKARWWVHNIRIYSMKNGHMRVNLPSKKIVDPSGKETWAPHTHPDETLRAEFDAECLKLAQVYLQKVKSFEAEPDW